MHKEEQPHKCKVCDQCFSMSSSLTKHMRIHPGGKLYKCKVCEQCFTESGSLTKHMCIHSGEKTIQM